MAIKVVDTLHSKLPKQIGVLDGSTTVTAGQLLYRDTTNAVLKVVTSGAGTTENIEGVATKSVVSGGTTVNYLIVDSVTFCVCDCTSNTAANQLYKNQAMTDGATIANSSSTTASTSGIFVPLAIVGAAADKKLYGYFVKVGQLAN